MVFNCTCAPRLPAKPLKEVLQSPPPQSFAADESHAPAFCRALSRRERCLRVEIRVEIRAQFMSSARLPERSSLSAAIKCCVLVHDKNALS